MPTIVYDKYIRLDFRLKNTEQIILNLLFSFYITFLFYTPSPPYSITSSPNKLSPQQEQISGKMNS